MVGGMPMAVEVAGTRGAPAVVLLHAAGTRGWMWSRQVRDLAGDLHVLVPDLPGHGRSNGCPWVSIADTAGLVAEVIASHVPQGRAHVVGLSLGGYVGVRLAALTPDRVVSATVSGVSVRPFPHPGRMRLLGRLMAPVVRSGLLLRANARTLKIPSSELDGYLASARAMTRDAFRRVNEEDLDFRVPAQAADSPYPVLAVAGENEHDLVKRSLTEIAEAFGSGEARLVPGVGHGWNGEKPELFTAVIRRRVLGRPLPAELLKPPIEH
ncbi:pimeloyl-ACP methyl ester carboxylesterase [Streptacidiphilus sp. EB129]